MNGNNVLVTIAKYWKQWTDPRPSHHRAEQSRLKPGHLGTARVMTGNPKFEASQELPDFPYARYAESLGLKGIRVDHPADIGPAIDEALRFRSPLPDLEFITDPEVPPLPPHIGFEQAVCISGRASSRATPVNGT